MVNETLKYDSPDDGVTQSPGKSISAGNICQIVTGAMLIWFYSPIKSSTVHNYLPHMVYLGYCVGDLVTKLVFPT